MAQPIDSSTCHLGFRLFVRKQSFHHAVTIAIVKEGPMPPIRTLNLLMKIANDITELIGQTPLVRLNRISQAEGSLAQIVVKLESMNPAAAVKDRIGVSMVLEAERTEQIQPGQNHPGGANVGEHGNCSGNGGCGTGLSLDFDHARYDALVNATSARHCLRI
jgi:hypothetical protein